MSGRAAAAETRLRSFLAANGEDGKILKFLGRALLALDRPQEARDVLVRAASSRPDDTMALYFLGRAELGLGHSDEAYGIVQRILTRKPDPEGSGAGEEE